MISFSCMVKKRALSKLEKLSRKPLFIFFTDNTFCWNICIFFTKRQGYTNIVYNYKFSIRERQKLILLVF